MTDTKNEINCYSATYEFLESDRHVHSMEITFSAQNRQEAYRSALRFADGRRRAMPDWFHTVLCVKVYTKSVGPIDAHGQYGTFVWPTFEWKVDTAGMPLEKYVERECEK